tara:strand:- start:61 stop:2061 length:2001 start_codon:yes stop_codon:yes gene_type:complete
MNSNYGTAIVGTVSGTSISFGSPAVFESEYTQYPWPAFDSTNNKVVIAYQDVANSSYGTAVVGTLSGTSISFGTPVVFATATVEYTRVCFDASTNKTLIVYSKASASNHGTAVVATVSGTAISFGSPVTFNAASTSQIGAVYSPTAKKTVITYRDVGNSGYGTIINATISGTSVSFSSEFVFSATSSSFTAPAYDSNANKVAIAYRDQANSNYGTGVVYTVPSTNSADFVGITNEAISSAATGEVAVQGGVVTNTSGLLPLSTTFGTGVVAKTGTVQALALAYDEDNYKVIKVVREGNVPYAYVGTVSGTSISYGAESTPAGVISAIFHNNDSIVYDTTNNKFIFVYKDVSDGTKGKAVVGTVSGTSISWGTPVTFASPSGGVDHPTVAFDANAGKCLISYMDNSAGGNYAKALVGTVSGTSISFGTTVTMNASYTQDYAMAYDANAQKVVVAMMDRGDNYYGKARVATISGTDVSFGTPVTFFSAALTFDVLSATYDSTAQKVVIMFGPDSKDTRGIVGTVSGTNISFGTAAEVVDNDQYISFQSVAYNPTIGKVGVIFNSDSKTRFHLGTVSGTDISFGSESMVDENGAGDGNDIVYEANAQKFVIVYSDAGNSNRGTAAVVSTSTDMTIGTTYYVQDDGSLNTTSSSVTAGRAIGTTSILLKG